MKIAHVAIWTQQLEELRDFYVRYFAGVSGEIYQNPAKGFESYMLNFGGDCQLELMRRTDICERAESPRLGICHLAFGCGSREDVLALTERLRGEGVPIVGEPRTTGDGYFESTVADPDGNLIELAYK